MKYQLAVTIDSEAIFNSGETDGNAVQMKVLTDEDGFVYYHSKTLKGYLKTQAMAIYMEYVKLDKAKAKTFLKIINKLFGFNDAECNYYKIPKEEITRYEIGSLKVGHLQLDEETKDFFKKWFKLQELNEYITFSKHELIKAQTKIRTNIAIEKKADKRGVVKKGGLLNFHTVREGLTFYSELVVEDINWTEDGEEESTSIEREAEIFRTLQLIAGGLRKIGANTHRGRGYCTAKIEKLEGKGV